MAATFRLRPAIAVRSKVRSYSLTGVFAKAGLLVAEHHAVRQATGSVVAPYGALMLAACRGRDDASSLIEEAITYAARNEGTAVQYAHWARAVVCNARREHDAALEAATLASNDDPELFISPWSLAELVEAAVNTGQIDLANGAMARLLDETQSIQTGWARGIESRSRALVSDGEDAERLYREAIEHLSQTMLRLDLSRAHLLYGEWLRRENRRADAREQLRGAHEAFTAMGAEGFADRARRELLATGEKVRQRFDDTSDTLTQQEEHIARLAREGRTNPEIGAQLFLSPRTVEWHLRKVFTKLGVSSRKELRDALPDSSWDVVG